jgi:hypothetical protein
LIGSNVIVSLGGGVRLTHISPLLYNDPNVDIDCIWNLLQNAAEQLGERGTLLAAVVADGREKRLTLRALATRLGALIDTRDAKKVAEIETTPASRSRRLALYGAAAAAVVGIAAAWGVWHSIGTGHFAVAETHHLPFHTQAER